jgi:hypothetical protein
VARDAAAHGDEWEGHLRREDAGQKMDVLGAFCGGMTPERGRGIVAAMAFDSAAGAIGGDFLEEVVCALVGRAAAGAADFRDEGEEPLEAKKGLGGRVVVQSEEVSYRWVEADGLDILVDMDAIAGVTKGLCQG